MNQFLLIVAAAVILAVIAGVAGWWWLTGDETPGDYELELDYEPDVLVLPAADTLALPEPAEAAEWEPDGRLAEWGGTDQHQLAAIDLSRETWYDRNAALTWDWSRAFDREQAAWCDRVLADIRASFGRLAAA